MIFVTGAFLVSPCAICIMFHFTECVSVFVFSFLIFWSGLRYCVLVPGTLAFHLIDPFNSRLSLFVCGFPLFHNLWPDYTLHRISISRIRTRDGHWVYWWSWLERGQFIVKARHTMTLTQAPRLQSLLPVVSSCPFPPRTHEFRTTIIIFRDWTFISLRLFVSYAVRFRAWYSCFSI